MAYACNPSTGEMEETDQDHIGCIVSLVSAWATRDLVSKIKQTNKQNGSRSWGSVNQIIRY